MVDVGDLSESLAIFGENEVKATCETGPRG